MLESREALILEVLKKLPEDVVLVGGYAVNAYVPPRFSIDCDLVVLGEVTEVERILVESGFEETEKADVPYGGFARFMHKGENVSFDLLLNSMLDRDSGIVFDGDLFKKYSKERFTVGRASPIRIKMRIADPELIFAVKFVSARRQDIRDIFMLAGTKLNWSLVKEIIRKECTEELIRERVKLIEARVTGGDYRDSLQGAFGKIPDKAFDDCSSNLVRFLDDLT